MGRHQIGRPEPGGQRQLGMVHDRAGGHRSLFATAGAFPGPGLGLQLPSFASAASGADKAVPPACREEVGDAGRLIPKAVLELDQGARKIGHGGLANRTLFALCSNTVEALTPPQIGLPDAEGYAFIGKPSPTLILTFNSGSTVV